MKKTRIVHVVTVLLIVQSNEYCYRLILIFSYSSSQTSDKFDRQAIFEREKFHFSHYRRDPSRSWAILLATINRWDCLLLNFRRKNAIDDKDDDYKKMWWKINIILSIFSEIKNWMLDKFLIIEISVRELCVSIFLLSREKTRVENFPVSCGFLKKETRFSG